MTCCYKGHGEAMCGREVLSYVGNLIPGVECSPDPEQVDCSLCLDEMARRAHRRMCPHDEVEQVTQALIECKVCDALIRMFGEQEVINA